LFKVLIGASIAMLLCCAAAAWAGPVEPATVLDTSLPAADVDALPAHYRAAPDRLNSEGAMLAPTAIDCFIAVPLSSTYEGAAPLAAAAEPPAPLDERTLPAVIPLPAPLHVGAAFVALAILFRRALLRAC
jgi:hypothetical protein